MQPPEYKWEVFNVSGYPPRTIGYADGDRLERNMPAKLAELQREGWEIFSVNIVDVSTGYIVARTPATDDVKGLMVERDRQRQRAKSAEAEARAARNSRDDAEKQYSDAQHALEELTAAARRAVEAPHMPEQCPGPDGCPFCDPFADLLTLLDRRPKAEK